MWLRLTGCVVILIAETGCSAPNPSQPSCADEERRCRDDTALETCHAGRWNAQSCEDHCASLDMMHIGCLRRSGNDECLCGPSEGTCDEERVGHCASMGAQWDCGLGIHYHRPCYAFCGGDTPVPLGCFYDSDSMKEECRCVEEGTVCEDEAASQCAGIDELSLCMDGAWSIVSCFEECGTEARCEYDGVHAEGRCLCAAE